MQELSSLYDEKEVESFFYIILENTNNLKRIDLALNPEMEMDDLHLRRWESILIDLKKQKPIQYIIGETEFYGLPFLVNKNTLIPRPETEELVDWIISEDLKIKRFKDLKILDIGTGSGCIAIALAKNIPNATVFALDVSEKALEMARKNAQINKVNVTFIETDILLIQDLKQLELLDSKTTTYNLQPTTQFDIIVSNPPYVRNLEKSEIKPNVLAHEPHLALFVEDNDALIFYRKIAILAQKNLAKNGKLYFEINQYLGKETVALLEKMNFSTIELKKDMYGNDRMISCSIV